MKHILLAICCGSLLGLTAWAQTPGNPPTQTNPDPSMQSTPQSQTMSAQDQPKNEKKLKGCIASQDGKYMLQDKHGKDVLLGGSQDLAAHVGHTVTVHGMYEGSDNTSMASGSSATGKQFVVTKIDMVSESCKGGKDKDHDNSKPSPYQK
jgi:hypothetical protein